MSSKFFTLIASLSFIIQPAISQQNEDFNSNTVFNFSWVLTPQEKNFLPKFEYYINNNISNNLYSLNQAAKFGYLGIIQWYFQQNIKRKPTPKDVNETLIEAAKYGRTNIILSLFSSISPILPTQNDIHTTLCILLKTKNNLCATWLLNECPLKPKEAFISQLFISSSKSNEANALQIILSDMCPFKPSKSIINLAFQLAALYGQLESLHYFLGQEIPEQYKPDRSLISRIHYDLNIGQGILYNGNKINYKPSINLLNTYLAQDIRKWMTIKNTELQTTNNYPPLLEIHNYCSNQIFILLTNHINEHIKDMECFTPTEIIEFLNHVIEHKYSQSQNFVQETEHKIIEEILSFKNILNLCKILTFVYSLNKSYSVNEYIQLYTSSFIDECIYAHHKKTKRTCSIGIDERMITSLRYINHPETNKFFARQEGQLYFKIKLCHMLNLNHSPTLFNRSLELYNLGLRSYTNNIEYIKYNIYTMVNNLFDDDVFINIDDINNAAEVWINSFNDHIKSQLSIIENQQQLSNIQNDNNMPHSCRCVIS